MKRILFLALLSCSSLVMLAQQTYTVNGKTLELKTEVEGNLDLLWNIIDKNYRYFVRTEDGAITELLNTRNSDRKFQEEYKNVLSDLTGKNTDKLKLTLYSLRNFIDDYNAASSTSYVSNTTKSEVELRLGINGGITNNPFVGNPDNQKNPLAVLELEVLEKNVLPRHSGFLQVRHAFKSDAFSYTTTELSLGYRFKFVNSEKFSLYGQTKFATLNFSNAEIELPEGTTTVINNSKDTSFDVPFIFGVGADIAVGDSGFISVNYGELFALFLDNQGNFSTDITLGYKFIL